MGWNLENIYLLLEDKAKKLQTVERSDIDLFLQFFPAKGPFKESFPINPNYLIFKILRHHLDKVSIELFAQRLGVETSLATQVLTGEAIEAKFPVVKNDKEGEIVKALIVPIEAEEIIFPDEGLFLKANEIRQGLERVKKLTNKSFFVVFEKTNFEGLSFTLALYSALRYLKAAENLAFTGVLLENGNIEPVNGLEVKLKTAKSKKLPLVFPSEEMKTIQDLDKFLTDLQIPVSVLFNKNHALEFEEKFPFGEEYLKKVFHIEEPFHYNNPLEEKKEDFLKIRRWLDKLLEELKEKVFKALTPFGGNIRIAHTQKVVAVSILSGIVFSKKRLPTEFYIYKSNTSYKKIYTIEDDRKVPQKNFNELFEIIPPTKETKKIQILLKDREKPLQAPETLYILYKGPLQNQQIPEKNFETIGHVLAHFFRKNKHLFANKKLSFNGPTGVSFAFGYYLEDYVPLTVLHKDKEAFKIPFEEEKVMSGKVYLTNTFSLNMLKPKKGELDFEPIPFEEAKKILDTKEVVSYISHQSTAQVLKELLQKEIEFNRKNLVLEDGDTVLVFQIKKRPQEGQIFTEEELKEIIEKGLYSFWKLKVNYS
ncbi:MAG: DUF1874 domain-containing protein [Aquificae bacterium]|nr:DUF1874 domain-containing protein [Aquificota bacterium]